jgi:hypothetical protein
VFTVTLSEVAVTSGCRIPGTNRFQVKRKGKKQRTAYSYVYALHPENFMQPSPKQSEGKWPISLVYGGIPAVY